MGDGGQDGAERFEAHGDVQQVSSEEKVVVVSQDGHGGVPHQIQKGLRGDKTSFNNRTNLNRIHFIHRPISCVQLFPPLSFNQPVGTGQ